MKIWGFFIYRRSFMKIGGFIPCSFMEWEGEISSVIFTLQCNWKCPYCHAAPLHSDCEEINQQKIFDYLEKHEDWITSVVISGGEPTIYGNDLIDFIDRLKQRNLAICLRTNGSNPDVIDDLTKDMLIDKISLDYKAPFDLYHKVADCKVNINDVQQTFELIQDRPVSIEYRTVLAPDFVDKKNIIKMGKYLNKKRGKWILTELNGLGVLDADKLSGKIYTEEEMKELVNLAYEYFDDVELVVL